MLHIVEKRRSHWDDQHQDESRNEQPLNKNDGIDQENDSCQRPGKACDPMGLVPVLFAGKGPGQLDAGSVILAALGQIITHQNKQYAH